MGEKLTGDLSGAIAYYAERINDTQISYITSNGLTFTDGERVTFEESQIDAITISKEQYEYASNKIQKNRI